MLKPINQRAVLIAARNAVLIRVDDGAALLLSPSLARALALELNRFADIAEAITEPHRDEPGHRDEAPVANPSIYRSQDLVQ